MARLPPRLRARLQICFARVRARNASLEQNYADWIRLYEATDERDRQTASAHGATFNHGPLISILMQVSDPAQDRVLASLRSVQAQFYPRWELCVAVNTSTDPAILTMLQAMQTQDQRIRLSANENNADETAALNTALLRATGAFVAMLDHGGVLSPRACYEVACQIMAYPSVDIIYSDEDQISHDGVRSKPYFKPDWNPDLMLGQNLIGHLGVFRRALVTRIGGFHGKTRGSQAYDLALRAAACSIPERIIHIPQVLYHAMQRDADRFDEEIDAGRDDRRAVTQFLSRELWVDTAQQDNNPAIRVEAVQAHPGWSRVIFPVPEPEPLVSVVIPTRDHADMLVRIMDGLLRRTDYPSIEVLIVDNGSTEPAALALLQQLARDPRVRVLRRPGPFNYSRLNNQAIREAKGSLVLLLNNDIDVIHPDWLREMVSHAIRPEIGAVGAKLLYPDGTIQHAGITIGMGGVAGHPYLRKPSGDTGYFGHLMLVRNVMAVTGACLLVRRQSFLDAGGLEETSLPVAFNDVDLCLKLADSGYRNLWTPHARLYHYESASRGSDLTREKAARFKEECDYMRRRWAHHIDHDPYWNPNLSLHAHEILLAFPPRSGSHATRPRP